MGRRNGNTKLEIIHVALRLFLKNGYTNTSIAEIGKEVGISKGNLMFHFHTKEHLLAELIHLLCDFQWEVMEREAEHRESSLVAYLLELVTMASLCEENPIAMDLYVAAYVHPMSLRIIRKNDTQKTKAVFEQYCDGWSETDYIQTENVVSGIEYAMFITENTENLTLEQRISSTLDSIMKLYELPRELRHSMIEHVLAMDYKNLGEHILKEFTVYVEEKSKCNLLNAMK